jgi:hypothetical protein
VGDGGRRHARLRVARHVVRERALYRHDTEQDGRLPPSARSAVLARRLLHGRAVLHPYALLPFFQFAEAVQRNQPDVGVYKYRDGI